MDQILGSPGEGDTIELTGNHNGDDTLQHHYNNKYQVHKKGSPIEHWVDTSSWPFTPSLDTGILIPPFPNESASIVPHCFSSIQSLSGISVASSESLCYQTPLDYRGICIYRNEPSEPLVQKARHIITEENDPSAAYAQLHDEAALQELSKLPRHLWNATEEDVFEELGNRLTPGGEHDHHHGHYRDDDSNGDILHPTLACSIKQPWTESVPVPLVPDFLTAPFLPDPAPDKAYGFSHDAFTQAQHAIIPTLTESAAAAAAPATYVSASSSDTETAVPPSLDRGPSPSPNSTRSHASPDGNLFFPFFAVRVTSMATGGTHHTATDEASSAAAVSLNSLLELHRRTVGTHQFDHTQPWFFSLTMDQQIARLNVHWMSTTSNRSRSRATKTQQPQSQFQSQPQQREQCGSATSSPTRLFNTELLSIYILSDMNALQDLQRAMSNILCYGREILLPKVCLLLDLCQHLPCERRSVTSSNQTETGIRTERGLGGDDQVDSHHPSAVDGDAGGGDDQQRLQEQQQEPEPGPDQNQNQNQQEACEGWAPDVLS
ncbi:hypothetical protein ACJ73_06243 [Blastomyces percursus]|uniref:DUF7924 domain-containing protein n=1 Tax=Blastomyces percursus TaxID=1658174 RepID=A0A1J9Q2U2_9EURO|nr:hypothetical protein ACJ73_06243 [Blastomyces percursus]